MNPIVLPATRLISLLAVFCLLTFWGAAPLGVAAPAETSPPGAERAQVPQWSKADLDFFLHGSMSTEVVPEPVLRALMSAYPDLFPSSDLSHLGLIPDAGFGWPVGFSRTPVSHLGGMTAVGINCAACHVGEVTAGGKRVRVLGMTSHFDSEAFFGSLIGATFRSEDPANMKKFLAAYLGVNCGSPGGLSAKTFEAQWQAQEEKIAAAMKDDPAGAKGAPAGGLQEVSGAALRLDAENVGNADLAGLARSMLQLFHNVRAALHVPDQPPDKLPPASGPGRNDAFGLLSAVLFGEPQPYAPVKYGLVWNLEKRPWVHWDANTRSPLARNLLASLGLGAPLVGKQGKLEFALVQRQTALSEKILAPRYPFEIDRSLAKRGAAYYQAKCASCHSGPESDARLYDPAEIGTQPLRPQLFTPKQAELFNGFLAGLEIPGYRPSGEPGIRSTQKLWAASLAGVWARSPYLHNGSVRTMQDLLTAPGERAKTFHRGSKAYDTAQLGYTDEGPYLLDTRVTEHSNAGHAYGTELPPEQKRELIEYLKTL
jgi:hypothetical protein